MNKYEEFNRLFDRVNVEASWCYSCARRNTCKDKETVAMEERLAYQYALKHVNVKAECIRYIKDSRVKENPGTYFLKQLFS